MEKDPTREPKPTATDVLGTKVTSDFHDRPATSAQKSPHSLSIAQSRWRYADLTKV
jgi:hypothetical protein